MRKSINYLSISVCVMITFSSCAQAQQPEDTFELFAAGKGPAGSEASGESASGKGASAKGASAKQTLRGKATLSAKGKWQQQKKDYNAKFVSINTKIPYQTGLSFEKASEPAMLVGWRGEKLNSQLVFSSKKAVQNLKVIPGDLVAENGGGEISSEHVKVGYMYYVQADYTPGVCYKKPSADYTDMVVADIIDFKSDHAFVRPYNNRPVWIQVELPAGTAPGTYKGKLSIQIDGKEALPEMEYQVKVLEKAMPAENERQFRLDLWQYPLTAASIYQVEPWSAAHFKQMEPGMRMLAEAGQSAITTSFFWDIFNSRARSPESMMIKVIKKKDGSWDYDFSNFDKWVEFMMDLGIDEQISVYGMAPLNYRYYYYDEAAGKVTYFSQGVNGKDYAAFWKPYLQAFEKHLKEKGWFDITALAVDEKGADVLRPFLDFVDQVNDEWKISFTGKYFPQLQDRIYDYSVISDQKIPENTIAERRKAGYKTTFYTSCWEIFPNTFMVSQPIDATWLSWHAASHGMDGYLRYAYNLWDKNVMSDTRSKHFASGDNFLVYPGGITSVRFEMLKDGIEDYEKIQMLDGGVGSLSRTQDIIKGFKIELIRYNPKFPRMESISEGRKALNSMQIQ